MRRVMMAKNLLLAGENAMNIFYKCGFSDYTTFYRVFKNTLICPPNNLRKSTQIYKIRSVLYRPDFML